MAERGRCALDHAQEMAPDTVQHFLVGGTQWGCKWTELPGQGWQVRVQPGRCSDGVLCLRGTKNGDVPRLGKGSQVWEGSHHLGSTDKLRGTWVEPASV